jgi:hypothetical protein
MSSETVKYGQLYKYLESLGYKAQIIEKHIVFRTPQRELPVILPKAAKTDDVRASHLAAVERILLLDGVVNGGQLPSSMGSKPSAFKASTSKSSRVKSLINETSHFSAANSKAPLVKSSVTKGAHVKSAITKASRTTASNPKALLVKTIKAKSSKS